ncbi:MAG: 3-oxoacyl-[acyl-carrier-protein] synthase III C-terminal domain-containing protein [Candidatus Binatia bacterium]
MVGIVSYGTHIPRLRLSRQSVYRHWNWLAPGLGSLARGERAMANFDEDSITMAVAAARDCLGGTDKSRVGGAYLASTTLPFADRLNAGIVAAALNLRTDVRTADVTGSLKAGTSALLAGLDAVRAGGTSLVMAADKREAKAASSQELLFGDGAAALLLGTENVIAEFKGSYSLSYDFVDHYRAADRRYDYTWEERWVRDEGYARIIPAAIEGLLGKLSLSVDDVHKIVYPCAAKRDHASLAKLIAAPPEKVADNLFEVCGETGAAHPLVMLVAALEAASPGERIVVASFGQGCDALCFEVTEHIRHLAPRAATTGALANKKATDNYMRYLKFRDLVITETGIRAEAPAQTALPALWRNRKTILGLVGGKCQQCGTPQFPRGRICVNPECGATDTCTDYEFAEVPATVKSVTGDTLAFSMDPPSIYGMVQFEGGGRFIADFTDCELADVQVGVPVKMSFRKHATDRERGFTGYFWKAVPLTTGT